MIPKRFDDGFRAWIALLVTLPLFLLTFLLPATNGVASDDPARLIVIFPPLCAALTLYCLIYVVWTHRVFTGTDGRRVTEIARTQFFRGPSKLDRLFGLKGPESWAVTSAVSALVVGVVATILGGITNGWWLPLLVILTAAGSWVLMAYSFALRYFRLHAAGETMTFDMTEPPVFEDFVTMGLLISATGSHVGGTPTTRAGLRAVRAHSIIAFVFNALVIAMIVSLMTGFISQG